MKFALTTICKLLFFVFITNATPFDSTKIKNKYKPPRHYIQNTFYGNYYTTPEKKLADNKLGLNTYKFSQYTGGFFLPVYTKDYEKDGGKRIANLHLLVTGYYTLAIPEFESIQKNHLLIRKGVGFRMFYNNGSKNVYFFNVSPFSVKDLNVNGKAREKATSVFVFNRTVSDRFSWRIGYTNTFILGNHLFLPIFGIRIGRLDKSYINIQFPRNISVYFPVRKNITGRIYTQPFGSVYNFANTDSLYNGPDKMLHFGRAEVNTGFSLDFRLSDLFSFYVSTGVSVNNYIAFSSYSYNKGWAALRPFYASLAQPNMFINAGMSFKFGKVKKINNNFTLYDVLDMNNTFDPSDENMNNSNNAQIPKTPKEKDFKKLSYKDIQDLIELEDMY